MEQSQTTEGDGEDQKPVNRGKALTVWLPPELVAELDRYLAAQVQHVPGARVSRHAWIAEALRRALSEATRANP